MKIKRLEIGSFGKLKNYNLDLEDGFQILYGENEDGKSTIMSFLYLMFYGNAKVKTINGVVNIRKNYAPWDGEKMYGAILFEYGNKKYRLEKVFGKSKATDNVSLWNDRTGEKERIDKGEDVGNLLFNISDSAFEKSVFIGCIGAIGSDGDISAKLSNLVTNGDESVSLEEAMKHLLDGKYELLSKGRRTGKLVELEEMINNLKEKQNIAFDMDKKRAELEEQLDAAYSQIQTLKDQKNRYRLNSILSGIRLDYEKIHTLITEIENLDEAVKRMKIPNVDTELEISKVSLTGLNHISLKRLKLYIEETVSLKKDVESVRKIYHEKKNTPVHNPAMVITKEELENGLQLQKYFEKLEKISEYVRENLKPLEAEVSEALYKRDLEKNAIIELEEQISLIRGEKEEIPIPTKKNGYVYLLCLLGVAAVLFGIFVHPLGYVGLLPIIGIFLVFQSFCRNSDRNLKKELGKELYKESNKVQLETLTGKKEQSKLKLGYLEESIDSLKMRLDEKRRKMHEIDPGFGYLGDISVYLSEKEEEKLETKKKLENFLKEKNSKNIEELRKNHMEYLIFKDRVEVLQNLEVEVQEKEKKFMEKVRFFYPTRDFEEASGELEKQENKVAKLQSRKEQIDNKLNLFGWESLTIGELIEKRDQIEPKIKDKNGNLIPEISEEELEIEKEEIEKIDRLLEETEKRINELKFEQGNVHSKIIDSNELEENRRSLTKEQNKMEDYYEVLSIACETLEEASNELTSTFGPMVNDKTSQIFSRLTNGKYKRVSVSKKFTMRVLENGDMISHESEYLSNGTIDQAYLSLRLAIAELITQGKNRLPILLDDVFMQYDHKRMKEGLQFLYEYSKTDRQIIYFTCHENIVEWCRANDKGITVKNIHKGKNS